MKGSTIAVIVVVIIIIAAAGIYASGILNPTTPTSSSTPTTSSSSSSSSTSSSPVVTSSSSVSSSSNSTINIGVEEDQTGAIAGFSAETIAMAQVAVNKIDAQGGVLGHQLKLFTANEIPDPVAAAQTLVLQDKVSAVVGISYAGDVLAAAPFLLSHKIITVFTTASNDNLMQNVTTNYSTYKYFFRITPSDTNYSDSVSNFVANVTHASSVYYVAEDLAFSHEQFSIISQQMTHANITVAGSTFVPLSQTDFSTLAATIGTAHPDVVIDCQTGIGASTFISELKANPAAANIQVVYMCNGALADPGVQAFVSSSSPGILNGVAFQIEAGTRTVPFNNVTSSLVSAYSTTSNKTYYSFVSNAYTAVQVVAAGMIKAGTTNSDAVVAAMETTNYVGPTGTVSFNSQHSWTPDFWYTQFQNNNEQVISPSQFATSSYQKPGTNTTSSQTTS